MSTPPNPTTPTQAGEHTDYYRTILHRLIDIGASIAGVLEHQATAQPQPTAPDHPSPPPPPTPGDIAAAYERISRAVRRSITLARHLDEPPGKAAASAPQAPDRTAARKTIIRVVEDEIDRVCGDDAAAVHAELRERLDAPDLDDDLRHLPVQDIIARICRDLGIAEDFGLNLWKRRTPEDLAELAARAAQPANAEPPKPRPPRTRTTRAAPAVAEDLAARVRNHAVLEREQRRPTL